MEDFYNQWLDRFAENRRRFVIQTGGDEDPAQVTHHIPQQPSDIVYENDSLKLIVEKSSFKKQKNLSFARSSFQVQNCTQEAPRATATFK